MGVMVGVISLFLTFATDSVELNSDVFLRIELLSMSSQESSSLTYQETAEKIYRDRQGAPMWVSRDNATAEINDLIERFASAETHGLDSSAYSCWKLRSLAKTASVSSRSSLARLDLELTDSLLGYLADLTGQRLHMPVPADVGSASRVDSDLAALVAELADGSESPARSVEAIAPHSLEYASLRNSLKLIKEVARDVGWVQIPSGPVMGLSDVDIRVPLMRKRLGIPAIENEIYGEDLVEAVRLYQTQFGLESDGIVGQKTLVALNKSIDHRRRQIEFSLERLRCLPRNMGERYVRVDVLQGQLKIIERDSVVASMRAIVGRPERPTPLISSRITSLEVNPFWNIPQKLAREDLLPKILQDAAYLEESDIRVYENWARGAAEIDPLNVDWAALDPEDLTYKLQQQPGPTNPLGRVKFLFYNPFSVYIHDTPHRYKFSLSQRFFSSGCVRVEDPIRLAEVVLGEQFSDFSLALESGETKALPLAQPIEVHFVYLTAWTDSEGRVSFRDDIYGYDTEMVEKIEPTQDLAIVSPGASRAAVNMDEPGTGIFADATASLR